MRARQDFHTFTTEGLERGFHLLEQALAIVGDNALIYAGLATFCFAFYDVGVRHDEETLRQGEQYATRALELDPQLPQALLALGLVTRRALIGDRGGVHDWLDGHPSLRDVAMTDQFYPFCLATVFACIGDTEEALTWLTQAVSWGFSNHRFLAEHNRLLAPLRGDPRFEALMEKAREKEREFEV